MKKLIASILAATIGFTIFTGQCFAAEKKAVLVVSFGTSYNDTRTKTIDAIEKDIAEKFTDYDVKRAFTSQIIIKKLKQRDGLEIDTVKEAMDKLVNEGYTTVICQPTHVMNGYEYDEMVDAIDDYKNKFKSFAFGKPLLTSTEDYEKASKAIMQEFKLNSDEALVLMGHGTEHFANATYAAFDYRLKNDGYKNAFVGAVEGYPDLDTVIKQVKDLKVKKVYLTPLMVVAGDHANNDMAGDEEDSWKTIFTKEGFEAEPVLKGLGEYSSIRRIYIDHVQQAIDSLNAKGENN